MIRRLRNLIRGPEPEEYIPGDWVHGPGGVGLVESITGDHAVVAYDRDKRDILPFAVLRRATPRGEAFDRRLGR